MIVFLTARNLTRHRSRTLLCVLGLAVSTALLYDMALLAGGLKASLAAVLAQVGYELRVLPHGGLPFSSEATLPGARALARDLESIPGVAHAAPLWATTLYVERPGGRPVAAFALGLDPEDQTLYRLESGSGVPRGPAARPSGDASIFPVVLNSELADTLHLVPGDTVLATRALEAVSGAAARLVRLAVTGIARFRFDVRGQRSLSLRIADLARIAGRTDDPASFLFGKLAPGADAARIVRAFRARHPEVDTYSVAELLSQVRGQLSYFQQFSLILGTVSLLVTFLLILTLLTLAVNERQGEIAILRALGLPARRVVRLIVLEGAALSVAAIPPGIALGSLASRGLDRILKSSPGLPADLSFFVFTPEALVRTVLLVLVTGTVAGAYPALLAARTNVVATLHREVT